MLDELLDIFERDRRKSPERKGGLRGRLATVLGDGRDEPERAPDRSHGERDPGDHRDDDDHYEERRTTHKRKRDRDFFDFGD